MNFVNILGGIDDILAVYLDRKDLLNQQQLNAINKLLSKSTAFNQGKNKQRKKLSQSNCNGRICLMRAAPYIHTQSISFSRSNLTVHKFCGSRIGDIMMNLIYNKVVISIFVVAGIMNFVSQRYFDQPFFIFMAFLSELMIQFYGICTILSCDYHAIKLMIRSFDFWVKVFYTLRYVISLCLMDIMFNRNDKPLHMIIFTVFAAGSSTMVTIGYSLLDGIQVIPWIRIAFGALIVLWCSYSAILYTFFRDDAPYVIIAEYFNIEWRISLVEWAGSSQRIRALFFAKQTLLSIFKKNKSTSIRDSYYIQWID